MKPKDLKLPFEWSQPQITIADQIFYVNQVDGWERFQFPGWSDSLVFGNDRPIKVEYCSGNGSWIVERAKQNPDENWVALEKRFMRVRKIWSKKSNHNLNNLFTICGEALFSTSCYLPSLSVSEVFINFPDPWPKKRHAKYRLIQGPFVQELWRVLRPGGKVTLATDHNGYSEQMIEQFLDHRGFQSNFEAPHYINQWSDYGDSYFDTLWRKQGLEIRYLQFQKRLYLR